MAGAPRTSKQPAGLRGELSGSAWVRRRGRFAICPRDVGSPALERGSATHSVAGAGCRADGSIVLGHGRCELSWRWNEECNRAERLCGIDARSIVETDPWNTQ